MLGRLGIEAGGRRALDAGASAGGFTDVLLRRGAAEVVAADVAYGQLDWALRNDPRVRVLERTNIRYLQPGDIGSPVDLVVADLSFISLRTVRDALLRSSTPEADLLLLVKPQFELSRDRVPRGGVVVEPAAWHDAVASVVASYRHAGCRLAGAAPSPLPGPKGNREFFAHLARGAGTDAGDAVVASAIAEAAGVPGRRGHG